MPESNRSNLTSIFGTENQTEIYSYLDKAPSPERAQKCGELVKDNDLYKIAAKLTITLYIGQEWKLDNTTLINRGGIWRSPNEWNFITNDDGTIYIETTSDDSKVLVIKGDEVVLEVKDSTKKGQLWIEGEKMAGGYTTLKNYESSKFLTATASGLKAKGNYHHTGLQYSNIRGTLEKRLDSFWQICQPYSNQGVEG